MKRQNSISFDNQQPSSNRPGTPMDSTDANQPIPTPKAPPSVSRGNKVVPDPTFRKGVCWIGVHLLCTIIDLLYLFFQCFQAKSWRMLSGMYLISSGVRIPSLFHSDSLLTPSYWEFQYVILYNIITIICTNVQVSLTSICNKIIIILYFTFAGLLWNHQKPHRLVYYWEKASRRLIQGRLGG